MMATMTLARVGDINSPNPFRKVPLTLIQTSGDASGRLFEGNNVFVFFIENGTAQSSCYITSDANVHGRFGTRDPATGNQATVHGLDFDSARVVEIGEMTHGVVKKDGYWRSGTGGLQFSLVTGLSNDNFLVGAIELEV